MTKKKVKGNRPAKNLEDEFDGDEAFMTSS
jgi:hypothetical protein